MNPFVLTWTLLSAAGIILSLLLLVESTLDLRSLSGVGNGRVMHAKGRIVSEAIRLLVYGGFLAIGIPALESPTHVSATTGVLIGANALLILNSLVSWYVRRAAGDFGMTSAEMEAEAVETALRLRETADKAALRLLELAARTASAVNTDTAERTAADQKRSADASERAADAAERTAENTAPEE